MELVPCAQCGSFNDASAGTCKDCHAPLPDEPESPPSIAVAAPETVAPEPEAPPAPDAEPAPFDAPPEVLAKVQELEAAIAQKPSARAIWLQLAQIYVDGKRRDLAAQVVERCLALDPTSGFLKHRLAQIKGEVASPPPPARAGAPPAPPSATAAPPRAPRAPTVAFQPVARVHSAPVRNYMGGSSKKRKLAIAGGLAAVGLAVVLKMWLFPSTRCLVTGDFRASAPRFSPTGKHLAFLIGDDTSSKIAVYDFAKGDYRPIAPVSAWDASGFSWSPDGTKLAFAGQGGEGDWREAVFVADVVAGGEPKRVASGSSPAWGADGQTLIMVCAPDTASFSGMDSEEGFSARDWSSRYCRVNVDSGQVQRMALAPQYGGSLSTLHEAVVYDQSPEGAIEEAAGAAAAAAGAEFEQFVDNVAAGGATNVAQGSRDLGREVEAKKYAERRRAALTTERLPFAADVFLVGISGGAPRAVTSDRQSAFPTWTADGERIVFAANGASGLEFLSMRPDGSDRQTVLAGVKGVDPSTVTLSPDGRQVFFVAAVPGDEGMAKLMTGETPADLHVASVGAKNVKRLANRHAFKQRYAVSPDGQRIVYEVLQDVKMLGGASKSELWLFRR